MAHQDPEKSADYNRTSQNLHLHRLHGDTATGVSENLHPGRMNSKRFNFSDLILRLRVDKRPNRIEKSAVLKMPMFVWTGPIVLKLVTIGPLLIAIYGLLKEILNVAVFLSCGSPPLVPIFGQFPVLV